MRFQILQLKSGRRFLIRTVVRLFTLFIIATLFTSIAASKMLAQDGGTKKVIICSTTQVADFTRQVVGDRCEVICVLAAGQDPHTYEPGNDDNLAAGRADLCLANGWNLEGDSWMEKLAESAGKPLVNCVDGVKPREMDYHEQVVKDPHAWFDPKNAWIYVKNIRNAVMKLEPKHAAEFEMRAELYRIQLLALSKWVSQSVNKLPKNRRILVTHHDAFGYFSDAYQFKAMSPVGWTTGEIGGVSIEQKQTVVNSIRETGVPAIFVETSTNTELLESIARESGAKVGESLYSDAMGPPGSAGETYIGMMRENVVRIVTALQPEAPSESHGQDEQTENK